MAEVGSNWDSYYSSLKRLPKRFRETAGFVVEAVPVFRKCGVRRVVDLGCGAGRHSVLLARGGFEVVGVDVSRGALRLARRWVREEMLDGVVFVVGSMTHLPLVDGCAGAVVSVSVMHHALKKDVRRGVDEVFRVLGPEGWFVANLASVNDPRYGKGRMVEKDTFWIMENYEEDRFGEVHHFLSRREVESLVKCFSRSEVTVLEERPNYWKVVAVK